MGTREPYVDRRTGRLVGGKWRLDAVLGEGATSTVYAATHRDDGQRAAIKVLRSAFAIARELVHQLLAAGYLVSGIDHPRVV
jgi:serine/threonine-protein kinase